MIRELLTQPQELAWLPWAVQYFFFIGIASCGALIAIGIRFFGKGKFPKTELITLALATTTGIVGPIALSADLHQPGRILNFYTTVTPWSWMWIGAIIVPLFVAVLLLQFILVVRENSVKEKTFKWLRFIHWFNYNPTKMIPWTSIVLALAASGLLLYTGKEVNVLKAQKLWFSPWLPWALLFSALQVVPMMVKTWKVFAKVDEPAPFLKQIQVVALLGVAGSLIMWASSNTPAGEAFRSLPDNGSVWLTIGFGLFVYWISLMLYALTNLRGERLRSRFIYIILLLMSLSLAWTIRWAILMQTQTLPKYNIIINPYDLSWGFDGALGIIATFGLWVTLLIVFWSLLNDRWLTFKGANHG